MSESIAEANIPNVLRAAVLDLMKGKDLTKDVCSKICQCAVALSSSTDIDGELDEIKLSSLVRLAAVLTLLRTKGETPEEFGGFFAELLSRAKPLRSTGGAHQTTDALDIVGTGGDCANTINISTASSILAAACGVQVIKHGSGAVSSQSGAADVLFCLGVSGDLSIEEASQCLDQTGITFCYAPLYNPCLASLRKVRKLLGVPTVFNVMGPTLNPGFATHRLIGTFSPTLIEPIIEALRSLGCRGCFVFHGSGGLDEITPIGPSAGLLLTKDGQIEPFTIDPAEYDVASCTLSELAGGSPQENAEMIRVVLKGEENGGEGPVSRTLCLNAGVGLWLANRVASVAEGIAMCKTALKGGRGIGKLDEWVAVSKKLKQN